MTRKVLVTLWHFASAQKKRMLAAIIVLLAATAFQLSGPLIVKEIIDGDLTKAFGAQWYLVDRKMDSIPSVEFRDHVYIRSDWLEGVSPDPDWPVMTIEKDTEGLVLSFGIEKERLFPADLLLFYQRDLSKGLLYAAVFACVVIMGNGLQVWQTYLFSSSFIDIIRSIRMEMMRKLHAMPLRSFHKLPSGELVTQVTHDTEEIKRLLMTIASTYVVNLVTLAGILLTLFVLDPKLGVLCLVVFPIFVLATKLHWKYSKPFLDKARDQFGKMNVLMAETVAALPMIQTFTREDQVMKEYRAHNEEHYRNRLNQASIDKLSGWNISGLVQTLLIAAVLWILGGQALHSTISLGVLYAFIDYLGRMVSPLVNMLEELTSVQRSVVSAEKSLSLLQGEQSAMQIPVEVDGKEKPKGHIKFENVWFQYEEGAPLLKNIKWEAKPGETVAIVGSTGSGKSTLVNLLLKFYEPDQGTIFIDGRDISTISESYIRKNTGLVQQEPFLFLGSIAFNIRMYEDSITDEEIKQAIKDAGGHTFIESLPERLDTIVTEKGASFSAGQRQIISFARALAHRPSIFIMDEATASIDSESENGIRQALLPFKREHTIIMIAHRLSTVIDADQILVMEKGEIVERGTHDQLMEQKGLYYSMVNREMKREASF
ncbi:ABC transporter ATP-binding protein [Brevibacillus migulae]|uniref:ABC transporter ATP-binding protein n=1 Tax=Brevibacillus migulae TaxID=1644114 RepID=UPI00106E94B8|nr:ABC transporter ATP-binding protein [Brevibacillus migulae]